MFGGPFGAKAVDVGVFFDYMESQGSSLTNATAKSLYNTNPWFFRCVNLRAAAISSIPFRILKGETEVEDPFNLPQLLSVTEAFLSIGGAAFWLKVANRVVMTGIQILNPNSMKVKTDAVKGIIGFEQTTGGVPKRFDPEKIVYFKLFNPSDDLGPGVAPGEVARKPASLVDCMNTWAANYFANGAVPLVVLHSERDVPDAEVKRIETTWRKWFGGVANAFKTFVLRRGMKIDVISPPVKDLAMPALTKQSKGQVASAFGVPQSLLEDVSNRATASVHRISFWVETIIPAARLIEATLNVQLFGPMGLKFEFLYNRIEAIQQDEAAKTQSSVSLLNWVSSAFKENLLGRDESRTIIDNLLEEIGQPSLESEPPQSLDARSLQWSNLAKWKTKALTRGKLVSFKSGYVNRNLNALIVMAQDTIGVDGAFSFMKAQDQSASKFEKRLQRRLLDIFVEYKGKVLRGIRSNTPVDLTTMATEMSAVAQPELTIIFTAEALRVAAEVGIQFDPAVVSSSALEWARSYTYELIRGITDVTRNAVSKIVAAFVETPGMTQGDMEALLEPTFGKSRASNIATTETTRAFSHATTEIQTLLNQTGIKMVRVWNTAGSDVCEEICEPLDGKTEDVWGEEYPEGPPAHPRCRCGVGLRPVKNA